MQLTATASVQTIQTKALLACAPTSSSPSPGCVFTPILSQPISSGDIAAYQSLPGDNCISGPQWPTFQPSQTPTPSGPANVVSNFGSQLSSGHLSPSLLALCVLAPLVLLVFIFICMRNLCKKHQENALPRCIPLHWRIFLSDCFVSLRWGEQVHLENRRREAEERERQRAESAVNKFSIGKAYSRPNSEVQQTANTSADAIPNPIAGGRQTAVHLSKAPPPLLVPSPLAASGRPRPQDFDADL